MRLLLEKKPLGSVTSERSKIENAADPALAQQMRQPNTVPLKEIMNHVKPTLSILTLFFALALMTAPGAAAQAGSTAAPGNQQARAPEAASESETDVGLSFYEAMNSSTTGNGVTQTPTNSGGGMFELRHIHSPFIGYEVTYGYNPGKETICFTAACTTTSNIPPQKLSTTASLVGLDWIVSKKIGMLRPFLAGGVGFFIDEPGNTTYPVIDVVRPSYLYGGGVDLSFTAHLGVRAQFRGLLYRAPNLSSLFPAQGVFTQTEEPIGGIFYRF